MQTPTKKRGVAMMEFVSYGSPQKFFAMEGQCHRVSPRAKRQRDLGLHQVGIKKSLVHTFAQDTDLQSLIQGAVKDAVSKALAEERKKDLIYEDDVKKSLISGITIRSLVADWSKTSHGKEDLYIMTAAVNRFYDEGVKAKDLPHNRKVSHGDLLTEMKHLTKTMETDSTSKQFLEKARLAIEVSSGLPGSEFLEMISGYVQANEQVHINWTVEKLRHVLDLVERDELKAAGHTPKKWICRMVDVIAKAHGWSLHEEV